MARIGDRLKQLRQRRNLAVRELALRAGVSHSSISLIERDLVSPSLDTLMAITDALGTTLLGFLSELSHEIGTSPFYRESDLPEIGDPGGQGISYRMVGANHPNRHILMLHERYAPRTETTNTITHRAQEAGIVTRGSIELTVGTDTAILEAGDGYYFDSRAPHKFRNISDDVSEIISAVSPPSF